jgi:hypothetical protein
MPRAYTSRQSLLILGHVVWRSQSVVDLDFSGLQEHRLCASKVFLVVFLRYLFLAINVSRSIS